MLTRDERVAALLRAAIMLEADVLRSGHFMSQLKRDLVSNTAAELREMAAELIGDDA